MKTKSKIDHKSITKKDIPMFLKFLHDQRNVILTNAFEPDPVSSRPVINSGNLRDLIHESKADFPIAPEGCKISALIAIWLDKKPSISDVANLLAKYTASRVKVFTLKGPLYMLLVQTQESERPTQISFVEVFAEQGRIPYDRIGDSTFLELPQVSDPIQDTLQTQRTLDECYFDRGDDPDMCDYCVLVSELRDV